MAKLAKVVRVITVAPIMAFVLCTIIFVGLNGKFDWLGYMGAIVCLCIVPSLSYPLEKLWKVYGRYRPELTERDAMRELSIYTSVIGYTIYVIFVMALNQPTIVKQMALTYEFSGLLMFLLSIVFKVKSSGHACGFMGPVAFLCWNKSWWYAMYLPIFVFIVWSSIKLKRHTYLDIVLGSLIPIVSLVFAMLLI